MIDFHWIIDKLWVAAAAAFAIAFGWAVWITKEVLRVDKAVDRNERKDEADQEMLTLMRDTILERLNGIGEDMNSNKNEVKELIEVNRRSSETAHEEFRRDLRVVQEALIGGRKV